jgi:hypothetical protein
MFTQAKYGRKIAVNYKLVRYVHELPAIGEDRARSRIGMQPVNYKNGEPEWIDVEEDFDIVLSRLNMVVK